jgi:hypothetical protein
MQVTDMTGRVMLYEPLKTNAGLQQYHLLPGTLPQGMYVVSISAAGSISQQKLIIN